MVIPSINIVSQKLRCLTKLVRVYWCENEFIPIKIITNKYCKFYQYLYQTPPASIKDAQQQKRIKYVNTNRQGMVCITCKLRKAFGLEKPLPYSFQLQVSEKAYSPKTQVTANRFLLMGFLL